MKTTYTKLKSGEWGIRVEGGSVKPGAVVTVTKKDGGQKSETVKQVVWSGNGVSLCAIEPSRPDAPRQAAPARKVTPKAERKHYEGEFSVSRKSAGKTDGYTVGQVVYVQPDATHPDGQYGVVVDAGKSYDDDYDEWQAWATLRPATDSEAAEKRQARDAAKSKREAAQQIAQTLRSATRTAIDSIPAGCTAILETVRSAGSERWYAGSDGSVYYTESSYDDGPYSFRVDATREQVETAKALGVPANMVI